MQINGKKVKKIHFVGIKGIAMAALAIYCKERGIVVTGSDVSDEFPSDEVLRKAGISVQQGFDATHIVKEIDLVIYTGAHGGMDNLEVKTARDLGIDVLPHGKALGLAMKGRIQISVAGSHGKTTTAAMIATILQDQSYAIGCGEIRGLGLPGHYKPNGTYFIAEADEYVTDPTHDKTPRFLWQTPHILVVTNIDFDHPDVYTSLEDVQRAFLALQKQSSFCIVNIDDPASRPLLEAKHRPRAMTYGESEKADFRILSITYSPGETSFYLVHNNENLGKFTIHVPGKHNVFNAAAAIIAYLRTDKRGVVGSWLHAEYARKRLVLFGGAKRRFERVGEMNGMTLYDDYAHHPKEIQATLAAARAWYPERKIICIFQPHTYSRTQALFHDFAQAFHGSDCVMITDIYASAREHDTGGATSKQLVKLASSYHKRVLYAPGKDEVRQTLGTEGEEGAVVIFMGAGDIYLWSHEFVS